MEQALTVKEFMELIKGIYPNAYILMPKNDNPVVLLCDGPFTILIDLENSLYIIKHHENVLAKFNLETGLPNLLVKLHQLRCQSISFILN